MAEQISRHSKRMAEKYKDNYQIWSAIAEMSVAEIEMVLNHKLNYSLDLFEYQIKKLASEMEADDHEEP